MSFVECTSTSTVKSVTEQKDDSGIIPRLRLHCSRGMTCARSASRVDKVLRTPIGLSAQLSPCTWEGQARPYEWLMLRFMYSSVYPSAID